MKVIVVLGCRLEVLQLHDGEKVAAPGYDLDKRIKKALDVYNTSSGKKLLLVCGGDPQKHGVSEARVMGELMARSGVPPSRIIEEQVSVNTIENAVFSGGIIHLLEESNWRSKERPQVVVVTSEYHVARAKKIFQHFGFERRYECEYVEAESHAPDLRARIAHETRINSCMTLERYHTELYRASQTLERIAPFVPEDLAR